MYFQVEIFATDLMSQPSLNLTKIVFNWEINDFELVNLYREAVTGPDVSVVALGADYKYGSVVAVFPDRATNGLLSVDFRPGLGDLNSMPSLPAGYFIPTDVEHYGLSR